MSILNALNLPQSKQLLYINFYPLEKHRRSNGGVFRFALLFYNPKLGADGEACRKSVFFAGIDVFLGGYNFVTYGVVIFELIFGE